MDNGVRTPTEKKKPQILGCYDSVKFDKIALWATSLVIIHDKKMLSFESQACVLLIADSRVAKPYGRWNSKMHPISHASPKLPEIIIDWSYVDILTNQQSGLRTAIVKRSMINKGKRGII